MERGAGMHLCRGTFSGLGMAALCPSLPGSRFGPVSVPFRARFRSAKNAAVLTLQRTQRKDWRF